MDFLDADYVDLLNSRIYLRLKSAPYELENIVNKPIVIIDEIQRVPELLNEVHRLIEEKSITFLLTGSSARKLRKTGTNLLAGRALNAALFPLKWKELKANGSFELKRYLLLGGLPKPYLESIGQDFLFSYVDTYLKEEIQAEALVRSLANYTRLLETDALNNSSILNYTKVAQDSGLSPNTVRDYYQILEDTLLGFTLPPWSRSKKRKAVATSKFYFFDIGLVHAINNVTHLEPIGDVYEKAFEHFIAQELRAWLSYNSRRERLSFWRTKHQQEVDFIIGDHIALEVKTAHPISNKDHKGLLALSEEQRWQSMIIISFDKQRAHYENGIEHMYWEEFLEDLCNGHILN